VKENLLDAALYGGGRSPVWQLRQDEVVVVAGCTPVEAASRCFGVRLGGLGGLAGWLCLGGWGTGCGWGGGLAVVGG